MLASAIFALVSVQSNQDHAKPIRSEVIQPIRNESFNKGGKARKRVQGGNPRQIKGNLVFDGAQDGNRQVDPQIAVGGGFVFHGTNSGFTIYDKEGAFVDGVPQSEFNGGIDPKMFFDVNNRVFGFNLWNPWDKEKLKPVNVSISETSDPRGAWNTYPVPAPKGVDGGAIGHSRKWLGYSFPGGDERTFVMKMSELIEGKTATVYRFQGSLGLPAFNQDTNDDLIFVNLTGREIIITTVGDGEGGAPAVTSVVKAPHNFKHFGWPPNSPMKGTDKKTASGDRRPKNLVVQNGCVWFSHTVNVNGRAGVQWHQVKLDGSFVQSGLLAHHTNSFIETSIGVNKNSDVLVGYQETGPEMFISGRCAWRKSGDKLGLTRHPFSFGEGKAATAGGAWGDYSGTCVDGDNLTDIWTVQSVANEKGRGSMVIARIEF